jgi:hypothetical protein
MAASASASAASPPLSSPERGASDQFTFRCREAQRSTGAVADGHDRTAVVPPSTSACESTAVDKNATTEIDNQLSPRRFARPGADDKKESRQQTIVGCAEMFDSLCQAAIDAAQTATMYLTSNRAKSARPGVRAAAYRLPSGGTTPEKKTLHSTINLHSNDRLITTRNVMATRCISS